jgi:Kef-type K+ transport system membrane component KefB
MENEWKKRIQKPIGVYVWTVLILLKFGILNFIGYFLSFRNADGDVYLPFVIISLALCVFTAGAAIWAFTGQNEGRIALLILVPLNIVWILIFAVSALLNNEVEDDKSAVLAIIQQVILTLFVIGMEWYFMSEKVVEYYKQDD